MATINTINNVSYLNRDLPSHNGVEDYQGENNRSRSKLPQDRVTLSKEALANMGRTSKASVVTRHLENLSTEEKQVVNDLKRRDAEVKAHEAAHMAAGGGIVQGGASYEYQTGPDGKMYAVGGEVHIDVTPERTPEGTIRKMQQVRAAALAPAQPSGTDRAVAAQATQIEAQARMERSQTNGEKQGADSSLLDHSNPPIRENQAPGSIIDFTV